TSGFKLDPDGTNNVVSWMGNVLVGIPMGGQHGGGFRPYVTGGVGVLQSRVGNSTELFHVDNNEFGWNAGAGAFALATDHVGFRGDVRYTRSAEKKADSFTFTQGNFDYWRGTAGAPLRW